MALEDALRVLKAMKVDDMPIKLIDCEQRSVAWYETRLGIPTASNFGKLVSPSFKERTGAVRDSYMLALLGERLTRTPEKAHESPAMARGRDIEPIARAWYREITGSDIKECGFVLADGWRWGCSPDGLGENVGLEIKCPLLPAFLDFAANGEIPHSYFAQVQGCMMITGRPAWDFLVYTDVRGLKPILTTIKPAVEFHAALKSALDRFCDELDAMEATMRAQGHGVPDNTPIDMSAIEREPTEQEIADFDETPSGML